MLKIAATRLTTPMAFRSVHAVAPRIVRPALTAIRYNSSKAPPPMKSAPSQAELQADWTAPIMSYEEVKKRTEQPSPNAYLIDVREPAEVILGSIPSSVNLPLSVISNALHLSPPAFKEKYGFEKPRRQQEVVFYCRSGKRSASAADVAKRKGYTNIHNYAGSWLDWYAKENNGQKPPGEK